MSHYQDYYGVV